MDMEIGVTLSRRDLPYIGRGAKRHRPLADNSAPAKSIEKLINQNFKILSKLDILISAQQSIDDRLKKIEGSLDESSSEDIIKTIIVKIARNLLKVSIYPSQDEFRDETEKVLKNSFPEFYKKFR